MTINPSVMALLEEKAMGKITEQQLLRFCDQIEAPYQDLEDTQIEFDRTRIKCPECDAIINTTYDAECGHCGLTAARAWQDYPQYMKSIQKGEVE